MIPELGHFGLILALCLALMQSALLLAGASAQKNAWINIGLRAALGQFGFIVFAFLCLEYSFLANDFSVLYVAENANTHLPWYYRFAALWGGHEGSLLLWVMLLGGWTCAVILYSKHLPDIFRARVVGVMGLISVGFLLFLLQTSNPFLRLLPNIPKDGQDLNALLQDPGLLFHPPILYMGYVGFAVAFAFAMAALLSGKLDAPWARWTRFWTLIAWCFLTLGITAGSLWSYRELGWGGWWFWDPVENASFMPWLAGTALLHSLIVTEKRGIFQRWTVLLAICAFSLSLLGTFLVRSGILTSVHAFALDPARGAYMLKFLFVTVGLALFLFALRAHKLSSPQNPAEFYFWSRESFLLLNNVILFVAMFTVLLGTIYPLIIDALGMGKISVGPPYFNTIFVPLVLLLLIAMGIGPLCFWRQTDKTQRKLLWRQLGINFLLAILLASIFILLNQKINQAAYLFRNMYLLLALLFASWLIISVFLLLFKKRREAFLLSRLSMASAHVGIAVCVIGIAFSSNFSIERNVRMAPGDNATLGPYVFQFVSVENITGSNYDGAEGVFKITRNNKLVAVLKPEDRIYTTQHVAMTKTAIDRGIFRDLYIALASPLDGDYWAVRLYFKPFVRWIWAGGALIFLGGLLAVLSQRYFYQSGK